MAVRMVTLLPWQPLESILNNLKSPSQTNKENLSEVPLGWGRSPEMGWLSHPSASPSDSSSVSSGSSPSYTFSGTFHISCSSKGLPCPFPSPLQRHCPELCDGMRIGMQSHAKDNRVQSNSDHPFYRACCCPWRLDAWMSFSVSPKQLRREFYKKDQTSLSWQLPVSTYWQVTSLSFLICKIKDLGGGSYWVLLHTLGIFVNVLSSLSQRHQRLACLLRTQTGHGDERNPGARGACLHCMSQCLSKVMCTHEKYHRHCHY